MKEFKVYFWKTSLSLNISLNITGTVTEVIRQIIDAYMNSSSVDQSLMKFPKYTDGKLNSNFKEGDLLLIAYELRMLENDSDFKPEMDFALEKSKTFHEFGIQKGVVII